MASALRAKAFLAPAEKEVPKINLSESRLECYKYPRNCMAMVLAEFQGGHRGRTWPNRELSWRHWRHVLYHSIFAPYGRTGDQTKGYSDVVSFSELQSQSKYPMSGAKLFQTLMEQEGVKGYKISDERYTFYTVNIPKELWTILKDPSKSGACPKDSLGIGGEPGVSINRWG